MTSLPGGAPGAALVGGGVVVVIDTSRIGRCSDLIALLLGRRPGDVVALTVGRGGGERDGYYSDRAAVEPLRLRASRYPIGYDAHCF